jgi:hypothetical protein
MRRLVVVLVAVLVVLAVVGGSFYGGMAFQRSRQANAQQQFFAERGFAPGGFAPQGLPEGGFGETGGPAGAGRGTSGVIESLEGDTLRLTTDGDEVAVHLTDQTTISQMTAGERSDLEPGTQIVVIGERDDTGTVTAVAIQILSGAP